MQAISSFAQSPSAGSLQSRAIESGHARELEAAGSKIAKEVGAKNDAQPSEELQSAYQELVAGTFYKMMLKALRSTQTDLPYIGGGQTEKLFSAQFDDLVTTDLSKSHGDWFSDPLFQASKGRLGVAASPAS